MHSTYNGHFVKAYLQPLHREKRSIRRKAVAIGIDWGAGWELAREAIVLWSMKRKQYILEVRNGKSLRCHLQERSPSAATLVCGYSWSCSHGRLSLK